MSDPKTPREIIASLRQQITAMKKEWEEERRENAELRAHAERVGEANDRLVVENDALRATLDAIIAADERAVKLWRAAHPGNELVIPDRGRLVGWLLEQNDALRADKERLDWFLKLDEDERVKFCRGWYRWTPEVVRAEIDAELRKEAQP